MNEILKKHIFFQKINEPKFDLVGRENELQILKENFAKRRMKNTILVGNAGTGKTFLIEHLAKLLKRKFVFLECNIPMSMNDTKYRGEFEEKFTKGLEAIANYNLTHQQQIVLFIDEIHSIIRAGNCDGGINASNILKPYLSKGNIIIVGATTCEEFKELRKDKAILRRLSPIKLQEMKKEEVLKILRNFDFENEINDEGIEYIYLKSLELNEFINPDISLEILDRCIARKKITKKSITKKSVDEIVDFLKVNFV